MIKNQNGTPGQAKHFSKCCICAENLTLELNPVLKRSGKRKVKQSVLSEGIKEHGKQ